MLPTIQLASRCVLNTLFVAVATIDGFVIKEMAEPCAGQVKSILAGLAFTALALFVKFTGQVTRAQRWAHEVLLNLALVWMAFNAIVPRHAESVLDRWSMFLTWTQIGSHESHAFFFIVWVVSRLVIWIVEEMAH